MARPTKQEGLTERVAFRLSGADYAAYKERVAASGFSPSEFFRECVLTNRTEIIARPVMTDDRREVLYLLNKASNNINQLAHRANADHLAGTLNERGYKEISDSLVTLITTLKALSDVD